MFFCTITYSNLFTGRTHNAPRAETIFREKRWVLENLAKIKILFYIILKWIGVVFYLSCLTNKLHFSVCVYCNRSRMISQRVNIEWRDCCSLHAVTSSVFIYSTHTPENVIYLFYTIKIQIVCWRIFGA